MSSTATSAVESALRRTGRYGRIVDMLGRLLVASTSDESRGCSLGRSNCGNERSSAEGGGIVRRILGGIWLELKTTTRAGAPRRRGDVQEARIMAQLSRSASALCAGVSKCPEERKERYSARREDAPSDPS